LVVAGFIETVGGVLVTIGLFTRVAAFIMSGEMAVAYFISHAPRGFFPETNGGDAAVPKWNFHKLLIDGNGKLVAEFPTKTKPDADDITKAIESSLAGKG